MQLIAFACAAERSRLPVKLANISGRLALVTGQGGIDVAAASGGRFGPDPQAVYGQWQEFRRWADDAASRGAAVTDEAVPIEERELGAPAPRPTQVFPIRMNYPAPPPDTRLYLPSPPATF